MQKQKEICYKCNQEKILKGVNSFAVCYECEPRRVYHRSSSVTGNSSYIDILAKSLKKTPKEARRWLITHRNPFGN